MFVETIGQLICENNKMLYQDKNSFIGADNQYSVYSPLIGRNVNGLRDSRSSRGTRETRINTRVLDVNDVKHQLKYVLNESSGVSMETIDYRPAL